MKAKCKLCNYEWTPRSKSPVMCPHCHSVRWNGDEIPHFTIRKTLECTRCGYKWALRKDTLPKNCPACRSLYWNSPRKQNRKEENMAAKRTAPPKTPYPYRPSRALAKKS